MNVRTVSSLPEVKNEEIISNVDLFPISQFNSSINSYESKKLSYMKLYDSIENNIGSFLNNDYKLTTNTITTINGNINNINNKIGSETTKNTILNRIKTNETNISNIQNNTPSWNITTSSGTSINSNGYISPNSNTKVKGTNFLSFQFNEGRKYTNTQTIQKSGNLFCYGWITAPSVIDPANAWVGIEAKKGTSDYMLIALQPWIVGDNSNVMQYIGFNCPVQKNMVIRITTGFTITDFSRSFSGRGLVVNVNSSATYSNINNCFVGYVLG